MARRLSVTVERFPLISAFTISRGSKTEAVVVKVSISDEYGSGHGECVPYSRYGETVESVVQSIELMRTGIESGASRRSLAQDMAAGAARNALDCALWDLEAKSNGTNIEQLLGVLPARPVDTAYTISLDTPAAMAANASKMAHRTVLKIKVGGENDADRMRAVRAAARNTRLIIDANEGWTPDNIRQNMRAAAAIHASLVEQPLPAGQDDLLARIPHPVPICADESVHQTRDLDKLCGRYDYVNLKLDKTGGLTEGLEFMTYARKLGFGVMVGCMVGTSLAMAPALILAQDADFVDLDGPLLLAKDRPNGLFYGPSTVSPPEPALWG
ncbi:dipeptide epimerase [Aureimonas fodinaquatilis]|uniref:Dipeptide epimerase n=1 Tax=Aureimonas fodinaquatilis TaxID=2565783 RepID=A0A5B0E0K9_9HYPH|nr:N-acetyl-D-Glu racemase DgcA [Aureimonas fodinaquatilis]KAA0972607.1 dipeptide epimerase [Aureimonas fodinaquatilis]